MAVPPLCHRRRDRHQAFRQVSSSREAPNVVIRRAQVTRLGLRLRSRQAFVRRGSPLLLVVALFGVAGLVAAAGDAKTKRTQESGVLKVCVQRVGSNESKGDL